MREPAPTPFTTYIALGLAAAAFSVNIMQRTDINDNRDAIAALAQAVAEQHPGTVTLENE